MYKYCSHCGHQAAQESNFCARCGTRLEDIVDGIEFQNEEKEEHAQSDYKENTSYDNSKEYTAQPMTDSFSPDEVDSISASCKVCNVEITTTDTDRIKVIWEKTDSWSLIPHIQGRTLHMKERYRLGIHNIHDFFHNSGHNVIRIELPRNKEFDLEIENETGSILVSNVNVRKQAELKTSIGRIEVENLKAVEGLFVNTGTGSMRISQVETGQIVRLGSQIGKIQADHIKTVSFFSNSTGGRCAFNDILTTGQFTVTGGVGDLRLDNITSQKMDVRMNASGNINCQNLYSDSSIAIYNTVGNITCSIRDDVANYTTHCHSDQGHNNYPEVSGKGEKSLNVRTSLGSVDVFFTGSGI